MSHKISRLSFQKETGKMEPGETRFSHKNSFLARGLRFDSGYVLASDTEAVQAIDPLA
jgi:hypothetical protein